MSVIADLRAQLAEVESSIDGRQSAVVRATNMLVTAQQSLLEAQQHRAALLEAIAVLEAFEETKRKTAEEGK